MSASRRVAPLLDGVAFSPTPTTRCSVFACALRATTFRPREARRARKETSARAWMVMEGAHAMATLVGGDDGGRRYSAGRRLRVQLARVGARHPDPGVRPRWRSRTVPGVRGDDEMRRGRRRDGARVSSAGDVCAMFKVDARGVECGRRRASPRRESWRRANRAARAVASGGSEHREDDRGDGGGGDGQSRRGGRTAAVAGRDSPPLARPARPARGGAVRLPRRRWNARARTRPAIAPMGRHMPDELLYPEEFETESEGEERRRRVGREPRRNAGSENAGSRRPGATRRPGRRAGVAGPVRVRSGERTRGADASEDGAVAVGRKGGSARTSRIDRFAGEPLGTRAGRRGWRGSWRRWSRTRRSRAPSDGCCPAARTWNARRSPG